MKHTVTNRSFKSKRMLKKHIHVGDLVEVIPSMSGKKTTTLWNTSDPNDADCTVISTGLVLVVIDVNHPYVSVITPKGLGWLHIDDTESLSRS
jgi:hypothetical protein